ncbi:MAG TPA: hypothetical protein VNW30_02480 [Opitutaceae bacterium]|jgi:hypothetical protein|nr:hypothetical protein [Opitutaceae bacterium]
MAAKAQSKAVVPVAVRRRGPAAWALGYALLPAKTLPRCSF